METHQRRLTFPQRNWLLLCVITAIIIIIAYYLIDTATQHRSIQPNNLRTTNGANAVPDGGDTSHTQGIPPDSLRH